ncbi:hypothetical protein K431DRAFT_233168 [Polychaeton citri CBS 116435]|uniref:Uncharacterized protein n=1 Tax=Polychaeton citri CBS 116435 TaxID=1314669 RepID=A0A9P4PYQ8_9PEZI|nr:hypothetical protein K431DRAFT_233168 [Polychaeton citri CBS 116435]
MPPRWTSVPFALFVLAELDHETINAILKDAQSQPGLNFPSLWLATQDYNEAPKKEANRSNQGTAPPISDSFNSPFVGQRVEEVAKWLKQKPDTADLDGHHFAIIDRISGEDKSIIVCKIGDKDLQGDKVDYRRYLARRASTMLQGLEYGEWEEIHRNPTDTKIQYGSDC